jgi:hypothetical protein
MVFTSDIGILAMLIINISSLIVKKDHSRKVNLANLIKMFPSVIDTLNSSSLIAFSIFSSNILSAPLQEKC